VNKNEDKGYVQGPWFDADVERMDMGSHSTDIWWNKPEIGGREVGAVSFSPPSDRIVEAYEETKTQFQQEFYDEAIAELRGEDPDGGDEDDSLTDQEIVAEIIDTGAEEYLREINNGAQLVVNKEDIKIEYEIGEDRAKKVKRELKRRGAIPEEAL